MSDWLIHDEETLEQAKREVALTIADIRALNERDPETQAPDGRPLSERQLKLRARKARADARDERRRRFTACSCGTPYPHGLYRYGPVAEDGGLSVLCAVCGERVR